MIGERFCNDFFHSVEILASKQPSPGVPRDVGQQEVGCFRIIVEIVAEDHVRQFVQHELLPMQS